MQEVADLDTTLVWHLQYNHYPPVPRSMVGPCKRAIAKANRGEWDAKVRLPQGVTYRGKSLAPVSAVIEQHHLDGFLVPPHEYGEYCECYECNGEDYNG
jgi:hypothetical protein